MSDSKKYYYLRLKDNFFDTEEIKLLESLDNGYLYSNILLKLYLKSVKSEGKLLFRERIPYNPKMISTVTGHNIDVVEKALNLFVEFGLIELLDNGTIFISDIQNFIGKSSTEADRKRIYRDKIVKERLLIGQKSGQNSDNPPPELEIELEKELELDNNIQQKQVLQDNINELWKLYPNKKGKATAVKKLTKLLKKHTFDELKACIERYGKEVKGKDKEFILHGSTFFNGRYEDYLDANYKEIQQQPVKAESKFVNYDQRTYDFDELDKKIMERQAND